MSGPVFNGTPEQQALADEVFRIMKTQGQFFAPHAPIRQTLSGLVEFLATRYKRERTALAQEIDLALRQNEQVFRREEREQDIVYTTARIGYYQPREPDNRHMFKQRLYEPESPLPLDDMSAVVSTTRPALTTIEPAFVSSYWQEQANLVAPPPASEQLDQLDDAVAPLTSSSASPATGDAHAELPRTPYDATIDTPPGFLADDHLAEEHMAKTSGIASRQPESASAVLLNEEMPATGLDDTFIGTTTGYADVTGASTNAGDNVGDDTVALVEETAVQEASQKPAREITLVLPGGATIAFSSSLDDLMAQHGKVLETALAETFDKDPLRRIVNFGRLHYPETSIASLGKNDLRRIRDYIQEIGEPLTDIALITDLYYHNPRNSDYEGFRFSLNYRLSRERDFEFVGVEGANLWSTKGLPVPGSKRIKASEMGHITAYLEQEGFDDSLELQSAQAIEQSGSATRLLTFFEWQYGVLPLDASLRILLPQPVLTEQRSAILRIESPQHYTNFLVEVRYPSGNRGGWIQGFDDFFREHLVAGALITLAKSEEPNVYTLSYEEAATRTDRLLTLDEKKNRHVFADISYSCDVDVDLLVSQQNLGRAKNLKSLPMSDRRKTDLVLEHVIETIGEQVGTREEPVYQILLKDLHLAYNVLRPVSMPYLLSLLEDHAHCSADESIPGRYSYRPEPEQQEESVEETEEEEEKEVKLARKWGYDYDDE